MTNHYKIFSEGQTVIAYSGDEESLRDILRGSNAAYIQTTEAEVERITTRALESKIDYSNIFE